VVSALVLAACGGGGGGGAERSKQELPPCPLDALNSASAPVEITMWHALAEDNKKAMDKLAAQFNASQNKVKVNLVFQTTYDNVLEKVQAGKTTGDVPEVAQILDRQMQTVVDSDLFLPAQSCVNADNYSLSDYLPQVVSNFKLGGNMQAMPFNMSTPILYFDQNDFTKAGLDPTKPPKTLDEVKSAAKKLKDAGASKEPFSYETDSEYLEEWESKANNLFVNATNGRSGIPTQAQFGNGTGQDVFAWLESMRKDGLIKNYKRDTGFGNLIAIGTGASSMTVWSTAALGTALNVLNAGILDDKNIKLGVAPFPGASEGSVLAGGAGLFMSKKAAPQKIAASWAWIKYLNSAPVQAQFAIETGYLPVTTAAANEPSLQAFWQKTPEFKVGYDQLVNGKSSANTVVPVIGPYTEVRKAVEDAMVAVLDGGKPGKASLDTAVKQANTALQDYADRTGG